MRKFLLLFIPSIALGSSGPLYKHEDPSDQREFQSIYDLISKGPQVFTSAGVPSFVPRKVGDITVDTSNSKVYIATATVTNKSWAILN